MSPTWIVPLEDERSRTGPEHRSIGVSKWLRERGDLTATGDGVSFDDTECSSCTPFPVGNVNRHVQMVEIEVFEWIERCSRPVPSRSTVSSALPVRSVKAGRPTIPQLFRRRAIGEYKEGRETMVEEGRVV